MLHFMIVFLAARYGSGSAETQHHKEAYSTLRIIFSKNNSFCGGPGKNHKVEIFFEKKKEYYYSL